MVSFTPNSGAWNATGQTVPGRPVLGGTRLGLSNTPLEEAQWCGDPNLVRSDLDVNGSIAPWDVSSNNAGNSQWVAPCSSPGILPSSSNNLFSSPDDLRRQQAIMGSNTSQGPNVSLDLVSGMNLCSMKFIFTWFSSVTHLQHNLL